MRTSPRWVQLPHLGPPLHIAASFGLPVDASEPLLVRLVTEADQDIRQLSALFDVRDALNAVGSVPDVIVSGGGDFDD